MFDYSKLRGRIVEKFGTIENFSQAVGLSMTIVSRKLNNKAGISREDIIKWSELLGIPVSEYGAFYFAQKV